MKKIFTMLTLAMLVTAGTNTLAIADELENIQYKLSELKKQ